MSNPILLTAYCLSMLVLHSTAQPPMPPMPDISGMVMLPPPLPAGMVVATTTTSSTTSTTTTATTSVDTAQLPPMPAGFIMPPMPDLSGMVMLPPAPPAGMVVATTTTTTSTTTATTTTTSVDTGGTASDSTTDASSNAASDVTPTPQEALGGLTGTGFPPLVMPSAIPPPSGIAVPTIPHTAFVPVAGITTAKPIVIPVLPPIAIPGGIPISGLPVINGAASSGCSLPTLPSNLISSATALSPNVPTAVSVAFLCNANFEIVGSAKITCQPDHSWSPAIPSCQARSAFRLWMIAPIALAIISILVSGGAILYLMKKRTNKTPVNPAIPELGAPPPVSYA